MPTQLAAEFTDAGSVHYGLKGAKGAEFEEVEEFKEVEEAALCCRDLAGSLGRLVPGGTWLGRFDRGAINDTRTLATSAPVGERVDWGKLMRVKGEG